MSPVYGILLVDFHKFTIAVVDLLVKPERIFVGVYFFDVSCAPAVAARNAQPVAPPAFRQLFPVGEFALVLFARRHAALPLQYFQARNARRQPLDSHLVERHNHFLFPAGQLALDDDALAELRVPDALA